MTGFMELINRLPSEALAVSRYKHVITGEERVEINIGFAENGTGENTVLKSIPSDLTGFNCYAGGSSLKLLNSFLESFDSKLLKHLYIGTSTDSHLLDFPMETNYQAIVEQIRQNSWPNLETLFLGTENLTVNQSTGVYGELGNITNLIQTAPNLLELNLGGAFQLSAPYSHSKLRNLSIQQEGECQSENESPISQETLNNLLASDLPELERLELCLDMADPSIEYCIEELLLFEDRFPKLKGLELYGRFSESDIEKLLRSKRARNCHFTIENDY